jgi:hypothetical protein
MIGTRLIACQSYYFIVKFVVAKNLSPLPFEYYFLSSKSFDLIFSSLSIRISF